MTTPGDDSLDFNPLDQSTGNLDHNSTEFSDKKSTEERSLAKQETREVLRYRLLMMLLLLVFAVVVSTLVYFYTHGVEEDEFESEFKSNGNKVIRAFQEDSYRKVGLLFVLPWKMYPFPENENE